MKGIVLKQSSARPTSKKAEIVHVTNPARGGDKSNKSAANVSIFKKRGYSGNQMATVLAKCTFREDLALANSGAPQHRKAEQLKTIGKCTLITAVKAESDLPHPFYYKFGIHVWRPRREVSEGLKGQEREEP